MQYIDLIALVRINVTICIDIMEMVTSLFDFKVVEENIVTITQACHSEVNVVGGNRSKESRCVDLDEDGYMENEHRLEDLNILIRHRLFQSIAVNSPQNKLHHQSQSCSFLGCFIPFIEKILLDGLLSQPAANSNENDFEKFSVGQFSILTPNCDVVCAALRCWGQYLLCGYRDNHASTDGSSLSTLQHALLRLPSATRKMRYGTAKAILLVKMQALAVYIQTFSSASTSDDTHAEDGAVLVVSLTGTLRYFLSDADKRLACIHPPPCSEGQVRDTNRSKDYKGNYISGIPSKKKRHNRKAGQTAKKRRLSRLTRSGEVIEYTASNSSNSDEDLSDAFSPNTTAADEIFNEISECESQSPQSDNGNVVLEGASCSDVSQTEQRKLLCFAGQVLEALLLGLHTLIHQQCLKDPTTATLALAIPLAYGSLCNPASSLIQGADEAKSSLMAVSMKLLKSVVMKFPW